MKIRGLIKRNQEENLAEDSFRISSYKGVLWRVWKDWLEWEISVQMSTEDSRRASPEGASPVGASPVGLLPLGLLRRAQSSRSLPMFLGTWDRSIPPILGSLAFLQLNQVSWVSFSSRVEPNQHHQLALAHSTSSDSSVASLSLQSSFDSSVASAASLLLPLAFLIPSFCEVNLSFFWFLSSFFESSSVLW